MMLPLFIAGLAVAPGFVRVDWSEQTGEKWQVEGLADRESGRPMSTNTAFAICSNTKPVTSVLALTFVDEGLINLDDPVSKYFPEFEDIRLNGRPPKKAILLRYLLTHLSGLAYEVKRPGGKPDMVPIRDSVRLAVEAGLRSEPGEAYQYCGLGFQIMGAVLEKVTGRKAADLMKERVFDPLEMHETTFYPDERMLARAAVPYYYPPDGGEPLRYDFTNRFTGPLSSPLRTSLLSGGLMSTVGDYLKFSQMIARRGIGLNGRRILSERTFGDYLLVRQTPKGDKVNASFDIRFLDQEHTCGKKGGLFGTSAMWDWTNRKCTLVFQAKSPYAPKGKKSRLDATGFGGPKTTFAVSELKVEKGRVSCLVSNNEDRHGVGLVTLVINGKGVSKQQVELAIGEAKRVEFKRRPKPDDKVEIRVR